MNKWEVNEHKQRSERVRSRRICPPLLEKTEAIKGYYQIKENRSLSPRG